MLVKEEDIKTPINSGEKHVGLLIAFRFFFVLLLTLASTIFDLLKIAEFLSHSVSLFTTGCGKWKHTDKTNTFRGG